MKYGAQIIVHTLDQLGVTTIFGMPGTQNVSLFEALRGSRVRAVVTTNEMAAAFAANGYYRATGKVGVLATIPGPGFTYALSGLAEAQLDSAALLHITSSSGDGSAMRFQHQYLEMGAIASPLVKKVISITEIDKLADGIAEGYYLAQAGEPGPVLVVFDKALYQSYTDSLYPSIQAPSQSIDLGAVNEARRLISQSKRILIFAGQGAQDSAKEIRTLVGLTSAAVTTTNSGRGVISETNPRALYYDYSSGGGDALNQFIDECDLVLALGCKFSHNGSGGFRLRIAPEKLIQVDSSARSLNSNYPSRLAINCTVASFLGELLSGLDSSATGSGWTEAEITDWRDKLAHEQSDRLLNVPQLMNQGPVPLSAFFNVLNSTMSEDACIVTDSGFHQVLTRAFVKVRSARGLVTPSDFQSMGFGIPAGIGAKAAAPGRQVIVILGDGGMAISGLELLTAVRERLDLKIIVFNDGYLNLIRMQQLQGGLRESAVELENPDFELLAHSVGAGYFTLTGEFEPIVRAFLSSQGVSLLEVFLLDGSGVERMRVKGAIKRQVRKLVQPTLLSWLKRKLRR